MPRASTAMRKSNRQRKQRRYRHTKPQSKTTDNREILPKTCNQNATTYRSTPQQNSGTERTEFKVSRKFLEQVTMLLRLREDTDDAKYLRQVSKRRLVTLRRKMRYLQRCNAEISERVLDARSRLKQGEGSTAGASTIDDDVLLCEGRVAVLEAAVKDIDRQSANLDASWKELMANGQEMLDKTIDELLKLLQIPTLLTLMDETEFLVKQLPDDALLRSCEEDCDQFVDDILGEEERSAMKYPRKALEDCWEFELDLKRRRDNLRKAQEELAKLKEAQEDGGLNNKELEEAKSTFQANKRNLKDAVEGARFAGFPCTSDGSRVYSRRRRNSMDIQLDPFGRKRFPEEGNDEYVDENDNEEEDIMRNKIMVAEIEERFHQNQEKTEKWLCTTHTDRAPAEISPTTPITPNTGAFLTRLPDIAIEDSVSVVAGVMLVPPVNRDPIERLNIDEWQIECLLMRKELASKEKSIAHVSQEDFDQ